MALAAIGITATLGAALTGHALATAAVGAGFLLALAAAGRRAPAPGVAVRPWQEQALRTALGALRDGVVVLDEELRVLAVNDLALQVLGLPPAADRAQPLPGLVDWPQLAAALQAARAGAPGAFEAERRVGDETRMFAVTAVAAGPGRMLAVVLHDLSRLRRLESHRREFVANVSHELKTPLAAIKGFVETLLDDAEVPPPTRQRFLQRIAAQVDRLATLVADLLTLSRLDDEPWAAAGEPHDLAAVVRETMRDLQPLADQKGLRFAAELPAAPVPVEAEREALRQIVGNLVDNAIKYTAQGSVDVRLRARDGKAELEVVDTGLGLAEPDQARVFERFYRVDRARSRALGGTGLGLSIVKNTVRNLGGEVGVDSRLGHGSRFWVRLPTAARRA